MSEDKYLTVKDICEKYKVSRRTVYRWNNSGLKHSRLQIECIYDPADVEEFIKEQERSYSERIKPVVDKNTTKKFNALPQDKQKELKKLIESRIEEAYELLKNSNNNLMSDNIQ